MEEMSTPAAPTAIFTAAALWLEDGDVIRPFASLLRVRGSFPEASGQLRLVVQHVENMTGDPAQDVYTIVVPSARVYDVYAAADAA
jgi:hypothetical protein